MVGQNRQNEPNDYSEFIICLQKALIILKDEQEKTVNAEPSKEKY